jgi:CheY-like chemotaxis protein
MKKLKVAVLEDSKELLNYLVEMVKETRLVDVVVAETDHKVFLEKTASALPDALLLDIDLAGQGISGLDIARIKKLPVLFVSGKTPEFTSQIEDINMELSVPVSHISKPITELKLSRILPKFIQDIEVRERSQFVTLDLGERKNVKIPINDIVYIETSEGQSGRSNNKTIFFTNRPPETLYNFSFSKMHERGFPSEKFVKIRISHVINIDKMECYNNSTHKVEIYAMTENKGVERVALPVSEDYRKYVRTKRY